MIPFPGYCQKADSPGKHPKATQSAFSLTELMVGIVVISVLLGLSIGSVSHIRKKMQVSQCTSNLRQIGTAALAYAIDNRQVLPLSYDLVLGVNNPVATGLIDRVRPYVGEEGNWRIFYCPDAPRAAPLPNRSITYDYDYQRAQPSNRFRVIGYYWLISTCNQWRTDRTLPPIKTVGSGTRIIATCPHFGGGEVHDRRYQALLMNGAIKTYQAGVNGMFINYINQRDSGDIEALSLGASYPYQ